MICLRHLRFLNKCFQKHKCNFVIDYNEMNVESMIKFKMITLTTKSFSTSTGLIYQNWHFIFILFLHRQSKLHYFACLTQTYFKHFINYSILVQRILVSALFHQGKCKKKKKPLQYPNLSHLVGQFGTLKINAYKILS